MPSLGAAHVLVVLVFFGLVLDSRRLRSLAGRSTGRRRRHRHGRGPSGIPAGNLDRVGLPLRLVQMRINVDWQDGGAGWDGPEVLPGDDADGGPGDETGNALFSEDDDPFLAGEPVAEPAGLTEPRSYLPVIWKPFPALLPPSGGDEYLPTTPAGHSQTAPVPG